MTGIERKPGLDVRKRIVLRIAKVAAPAGVPAPVRLPRIRRASSHDARKAAKRPFR